MESYIDSVQLMVTKVLELLALLAGLTVVSIGGPSKAE